MLDKLITVWYYNYRKRERKRGTQNEKNISIRYGRNNRRPLWSEWLVRKS